MHMTKDRRIRKKLGYNVTSMSGVYGFRLGRLQKYFFPTVAENKLDEFWFKRD